MIFFVLLLASGSSFHVCAVRLPVEDLPTQVELQSNSGNAWADVERNTSYGSFVQTFTDSGHAIKSIPNRNVAPRSAAGLTPPSGGRFMAKVVAMVLMFFLVGWVVSMGVATHQTDPEVVDLMEVHGLVGEAFVWKDPLCLKDFDKEVLCKALPRLAVALVVCTAGLYCNNVSQAWLQKHMSGYYEAQWGLKHTEKPVVLWDLGYQLLPGMESTALADAFARGIPVLICIRLLLFPGPLSMRWSIMSRTLLIWGLLWGVRAIMITSTVLPNPDQTCKPEIAYPDNIFMEAFANMPFVFWHSESTCQDVLFSGHTVVLTLFTMVLLRYYRWAPWVTSSTPSTLPLGVLFKTAVIMTMLAGYYLIIASRLHYTADVLIASLTTVLVFHAYHCALSSAYLPSSHARALWSCNVYDFIRWFDQDAVDVSHMGMMQTRRQCSADC